MNTKIDTECFVLLSEGFADKNFLHQLSKESLAELSFSFPFPTDKFYSVSMFNRMLSALRADKIGLGYILGIILVADSCDDPLATFSSVQAEIKKAEWGAMPNLLEEVAFNEKGLPPIAVLTIPSATEGGGLETLYTRDLEERLPDLSKIADQFLFSEHTEVVTWNLEKQGKAKYAAMVAASHRDDPSRAASAAFRTPPTISISSAKFAPLSSRIRSICDKMTNPA